jgi:hypothetical protein
VLPQNLSAMKTFTAQSLNDCGASYAIIAGSPIQLTNWNGAKAHPFLAIKASNLGKQKELLYKEGNLVYEQIEYSPGFAVDFGDGYEYSHLKAMTQGQALDIWGVDFWMSQGSFGINDQTVYAYLSRFTTENPLLSILWEIQFSYKGLGSIHNSQISDTAYSFLWAKETSSDLKVLLSVHMMMATDCFSNARPDSDNVHPSELLPKSTAALAKRKKIGAKLRRQVFDRDSYRCVDCGISPSIDPSCVLHIDHRIPVSKGGTNDLDNLQVLCDQCNAGKGASLDWKLT